MNVFYYICEFVWVAVRTWMTFEVLSSVAEPKRDERVERAVRILTMVLVGGHELGNRMTTTTLFSNTSLLVNSFIICLVACGLYKVRFVRSFAVSYLFWVAVACTDFLVQTLLYISLVGVFETRAVFLHVGTERGIYLLVHTGVVWGLGRILCKELAGMLKELRYKTLTGVVSVTVTFFLMAYLQRVYQLDVSAEYLGIWELIILVAVIVSVMTISYVLQQRKIQRDNLMQLKMETLLENYRQVMELYQEKSVLVHDEKNHMLAIQSMVASGENEKALSYMRDISVQLQGKENRQITGHEFLDLILNLKLQQAADRGIKPEIWIDRMEKLAMREMDISTLFANLLDNAIEANEELPETADRWIRLTGRRHGNVLCVKLENPVHGAKELKEGQFYTTKKDKRYHGFGMLSIQKVVDTYDGYMECEIRDGVFSQQFFLNCFEDREDENE